ncbi:MAG: TPM domain-containing protein, partial [Chloroflexota bacterium]
MRALPRRSPPSPAARAILARLSAAALTILALLALLVPARPALAADAPVLQGGITDLSGVVIDPTAIQDAQAQLYEKTGTQLYVLFLPTTDGQDIYEFAQAVDQRNKGTLTSRDALLIIATEDRDYTFLTGADLSDRVSATELDVVAQKRMFPRLANNDWAGGAAAAAAGLQDALTGNVTSSGSQESKGGFPVIPVALLILVLGVGIFIWTRISHAKANRAEAQVQEELGRKASAMLVETDEALRTADQEVGFAEAQFGGDEAKALAAAYQQAKAELTAAFKISAALDDETPETPEQRRQMLDEIVERCTKANALVSEQKTRLDQLRELGKNAEQVIPDVQKRIDDTT